MPVSANELVANENGSIKSDVHVGDLVEILADGKFFLRRDDQPERYAGYVASIDNRAIGLSSSHTSNVSYGYVSGEESPRKPAITRIELLQVTHYRIL